MTNLLPERKNIRNFRPDDIEGKFLFKQCRLTLDRFLADTAREEVADFCMRAERGAAPASQDAFHALQHSLSEIRQLHQSFQRVVGMSAERGEEVPTMSYVAEYIGRYHKNADMQVQAMASEAEKVRPVHAEDVSKEAFRNLLLEFGVLHYWLNHADAEPAYVELLSCQRKHAHRVMALLDFPAVKETLLQKDMQAFQELRRDTAVSYAELQKALGVSIPDAAIAELVEHPLTSLFSRASLEDIRAQFFQLPEAYKDSFAARLLMPGASEGPGFKR